ncbi:MAG TPA: hypothetical protein VK907_14580 [Phnomibacter sp.]|nr:hypothetical protein [Phnomibacter sp.]
MKKFFLFRIAGVMAMVVCSFLGQAQLSGTYTFEAEQYIKGIYGKDIQPRWSITPENILRAEFEFEDENISLFFNRENEHLATTRPVTFQQLPPLARARVKEKLSWFNPTSIIHFISDLVDAYFMEGYDGDKKQIWKVDPNGQIERFNRTPY